MYNLILVLQTTDKEHIRFTNVCERDGETVEMIRKKGIISKSCWRYDKNIQFHQQSMQLALKCLLGALALNVGKEMGRRVQTKLL